MFFCIRRIRSVRNSNHVELENLCYTGLLANFNFFIVLFKLESWNVPGSSFMLCGYINHLSKRFELDDTGH